MIDREIDRQMIEFEICLKLEFGSLLYKGRK